MLRLELLLFVLKKNRTTYIKLFAKLNACIREEIMLLKSPLLMKADIYNQIDISHLEDIKFLP